MSISEIDKPELRGLPRCFLTGVICNFECNAYSETGCRFIMILDRISSSLSNVDRSIKDLTSNIQSLEEAVSDIPREMKR